MLPFLLSLYTGCFTPPLDCAIADTGYYFGGYDPYPIENFSMQSSEGPPSKAMQIDLDGAGTLLNSVSLEMYVENSHPNRDAVLAVYYSKTGPTKTQVPSFAADEVPPRAVQGIGTLINHYVIGDDPNDADLYLREIVPSTYMDRTANFTLVGNTDSIMSMDSIYLSGVYCSVTSWNRWYRDEEYTESEMKATDLW
jgi:hypothetical protein